jgi:hypothetical protein
MENVDVSILKSLYETDIEFFKANNIPEFKIKKYFYSEEFIEKLNTLKLDKYKQIKNLKAKIKKFLTQEILYVWEWEI